MNQQNLQEEYIRYLPKFQTFQRWIHDDLKNSSIEGHANFLVAMGIFNYIEILGSFYRYKKKYKIRNKEYGYVSRFNFAINQLFSKEYITQFNLIRKIFGAEPYDMFRSGMTHEYLVKTYCGKNDIEIRFTVYGVSKVDEYDRAVAAEKCGIKVTQKNPKFYQIDIINPKLIEDLYIACEEFINRMKANRQNYRIYFVKRCWDINFSALPPFSTT